MKILLSFLFYALMAGTTATVGTNLKEETPKVKTEIKPVAPVTGNTHKPVVIKADVKHGFKAFGAKALGSNLVVTWAAESSQIAHFLLEYSVDGKLFQLLAQISYTGTAAHKYKGEAKVGYYRVGSVKKDGNIEYSAIKKMRIAR